MSQRAQYPTRFTAECIKVINHVTGGSGVRVGDYYAAQVTITPELAKYLLARNIENNRTRKDKAVAAYGRDLTDGDWRSSVSEILVTFEGKLGDGQHRLLAVVATGIPAEFIVRFGISEEDIAAIDQGAARRVDEQVVMDMPGIKPSEAKEIVAIAKRVLHYRAALPKVLIGEYLFPINTANTNAYVKPSHAEQRKEIKEHADLYRQAREWGHKIDKVHKVPAPWGKGLWGTAAFILLETDPSSVAFLRELAFDGVAPSVRVQDFIRVARDRSRMVVHNPNKVLPEQLWKFTAALSFTFHAYNAWREGPSHSFKNGIGPCDLHPSADPTLLEFQFPVKHPAYRKPRIRGRATKGTSL